MLSEFWNNAAQHCFDDSGFHFSRWDYECTLIYEKCDKKDISVLEGSQISCYEWQA